MTRSGGSAKEDVEKLCKWLLKCKCNSHVDMYRMVDSARYTQNNIAVLKLFNYTLTLTDNNNTIIYKQLQVFNVCSVCHTTTHINL